MISTISCNHSGTDGSLKYAAARRSVRALGQRRLAEPNNPTVSGGQLPRKDAAPPRYAVRGPFGKNSETRVKQVLYTYVHWTIQRATHTYHRSAINMSAMQARPRTQADVASSVPASIDDTSSAPQRRPTTKCGGQQPYRRESGAGHNEYAPRILRIRIRIGRSGAFDVISGCPIPSHRHRARVLGAHPHGRHRPWAIYGLPPQPSHGPKTDAQASSHILAVR